MTGCIRLSSMRVKKKMHVIEQPLPPAPEPVAEPDIVAQWTALYDAHTEIACLMLGSMTPELHRQFELHYPYDMIQELRSMFEKQAGVEKREGQLVKFMAMPYWNERKLKQGALYLYVGNGVCTQVEAIRSFDLVLPNGLVICFDKLSPPPFAPTITRGVVSIYCLVDNGFVQCFTDYGISVSKNDVLYFNAIARNGIYEIDMHDLVPNVNSIYNVSNKRVRNDKQACTRWVLKSTDDESFDKCESCLSGKMTKKPFPHSNERAKDLLGIIHTDGCEAIVKRHTPDKLEQDLYAEFFEKRLISQEISGRAVDLEEIQEEEDTTPSEITSNIPQEVEEVEEHSLGDLGEPANYKAAMLDPESKKWVDVMNAEMQSMIDNMVWVLVDLPPNCKTVGSKWIFKKKTEMDGNIHIYKARLVAKGYTQTYMVDYEETFSPVADIRAIRILIFIAAFYDYEIWQIDVKIVFLNGYLDEDIYMV
ncbi:retrotransposon protein, putative, ty1-copia subclass [Tanacetum coccineum]|uniref:Retrotransposon protein, putative, ty1-copia subclass n=1 Tax=Tanacetum coccineum TaxID=301880 RepID=A0ABQ4X3S3_9ASTR